MKTRLDLVSITCVYTLYFLSQMAHGTERYVRSHGIDVTAADSLIISRDSTKNIRVTDVKQWTRILQTFKVQKT